MSNIDRDKKLVNDTTLDALIAALPRERQPDRDLWAGIDCQLNSDGTRNTTRPVNKSRLLQPAGLWLTAIAAATLLIWFGTQQPTDSLSTPQPDLTIAENRLHPVVSADADITLNFELQLAATMANLQTPAIGYEAWQKSYQSMQAASLQLRNALQTDPNNSALLRQLTSLYQRQLSYLQQVVDNPSNFS